MGESVAFSKKFFDSLNPLKVTTKKFYSTSKFQKDYLENMKKLYSAYPKQFRKMIREKTNTIKLLEDVHMDAESNLRYIDTGNGPVSEYCIGESVDLYSEFEEIIKKLKKERDLLNSIIPTVYESENDFSED